jgi:hypothetical protein
MGTTITTPRRASPERWQAALLRVIREGIQVRQLAGSGAWIATSGSDAATAYELEVAGELVHGCACLAGLNGDPVCKHRAAYYLMVGVLDPEPDPPAPALTRCGYCSGRGEETVVGKSGAAYRFACRLCEGTGTVAVEDGDDEPPPPASARCRECAGAGLVYVAECERAGFPYPPCPACTGPRQLAA